MYFLDINIIFITINLSEKQQQQQQKKPKKQNTHTTSTTGKKWGQNHIVIVPAIMSSTELIFSNTCWIRPTAVLVCRFRTLFRRTAVNMLQISAWQVMSQCSSSSTRQLMLSASWIMKLVSRSNSPPTNCKIRWDRRKMCEEIEFLCLSHSA